MSFLQREQEDINHEVEWLNLSLGGDGSSSSASSSSSSSKLNFPTTTRVFSCNFCKRKFFSPQALGGHQNAHRREREAARRYHSLKMIVSMNMMSSVHLNHCRSLGAQVHSLVQKSNGEANNCMVSRPRFTDDKNWVGPTPTTVCSNSFVAHDSIWPGSFHVGPTTTNPKQPSDLVNLDLNLKL